MHIIKLHILSQHMTFEIIENWFVWNNLSEQTVKRIQAFSISYFASCHFYIVLYK